MKALTNINAHSLADAVAAASAAVDARVVIRKDPL